MDVTTFQESLESIGMCSLASVGHVIDLPVVCCSDRDRVISAATTSDISLGISCNPGCDSPCGNLKYVV